MIITEGLKKRFAKDTNLPIKIFTEPYFSHFLDLYEAQFGARTKYNEFCELLENFESEQDYFEEYNRVKDAAITYLAENPAMQAFKNADRNLFKITNTGLPSHDIYKQTNIGRHFVSIDMKKANFTALKHYNPKIVGEKETYEDFLGMFTDSQYFKSSKYVRQVIFGNQAPGGQVVYEQYLMDIVMDAIFVHCPPGIDRSSVAYFGTDEIVLDITNFVNDGKLDEDLLEGLKNALLSAKASRIDVRAEFFQLIKITGTSGCMRKFEFDTKDKQPDLKCVTALDMPFVIRAINGEVPKPNDFVFSYEGKLAKFLEPIKVEFTTDPTK